MEGYTHGASAGSSVLEDEAKLKFIFFFNLRGHGRSLATVDMRKGLVNRPIGV